MLELWASSSFLQDWCSYCAKYKTKMQEKKKDSDVSNTYTEKGKTATSV